MKSFVFVIASLRKAKCVCVFIKGVLYAPPSILLIPILLSSKPLTVIGFWFFHLLAKQDVSWIHFNPIDSSKCKRDLVFNYINWKSVMTGWD